MTPSMIGERLGTYAIVRALASGGMADVYLAREDGTGREVALKVMRGSTDFMRELFGDEARVGRLLDHPNLARVTDVGAAAGVHYLAMDFVRGMDLRQLQNALVRADRDLPYALAVSIISAAAAGLDHAHRKLGPDGAPLHLVHRDVSLSNIMVTDGGGVKVIDFGIASAAGGEHRTEPGIIRGKAAYMAPEQCLGETVDARTDVFALGVVLYELATGHRCFDTGSDLGNMIAITRGTYVAPSARVAGFPEALERVIATALAVDPAQRFASAAHLIGALRATGLAGSSPAALAQLIGELSAVTAVAPRLVVSESAELATSPQLPVHLLDDDAPTGSLRALRVGRMRRTRRTHAPMYLAA